MVTLQLAVCNPFAAEAVTIALPECFAITTPSLIVTTSSSDEDHSIMVFNDASVGSKSAEITTVSPTSIYS